MLGVVPSFTAVNGATISAIRRFKVEVDALRVRDDVQAGHPLRSERSTTRRASVSWTRAAIRSSRSEEHGRGGGVGMCPGGLQEAQQVLGPVIGLQAPVDEGRKEQRRMADLLQNLALGGCQRVYRHVFLPLAMLVSFHIDHGTPAVRQKGAYAPLWLGRDRRKMD